MFVETVEDSLKIFKVVVNSLGEDNDVVNVNHTLDPFKPSKNHIHTTLESWGTISETEGHDVILKQAVAGDEGSFVTVSLGDGNLPEARKKV
jgi:hypothetical protein